MKTKAIVALMVAGALGFTACTKKIDEKTMGEITQFGTCLLYTSPSPRDRTRSRMPSSA